MPWSAFIYPPILAVGVGYFLAQYLLTLING